MRSEDKPMTEPFWGTPDEHENSTPSSFNSNKSFDSDTHSNLKFSSVTSERNQYKLAEELQKKGYHPVMLFGTRASGKSSLLASLFYYLQTDPESPAISVRGEWIIPTDSAYGQSVAALASDFLNHVVNNFHEGQAAPSTRDEFPFYIPVILRPNNGLPEVKIAFLESRGEWYQIDKKYKDLYPELRDEVSDVYRNFTKGISILLIAPYVMGEAYSDETPSEISLLEMKESDASLYGALQAYQTNRKSRDLDKYLFVMTKWDAHTQSIIDKSFIKPPNGMVANLIFERFPRSWTLFQNMQEVEAQCMQYSAGVMSGDARVDVPQHLRPIMNRFPQMLWRWLYFNASEGYELFTPNTKNKNSESSADGKNVFMGILKKLLT